MECFTFVLLKVIKISLMHIPMIFPKISSYCCKFCLSFVFIVLSLQIKADNGYNLWLNYNKLDHKTIISNYSTVNSISVEKGVKSDEILTNAVLILSEKLGILLGRKINIISKGTGSVHLNINPNAKLGHPEGYTIKRKGSSIIIESNSSKGVLYGIFKLLELVRLKQSLIKINIEQKPAIDIRVLNHWDNLDRTIERGYAGFSIWNWHELPENVDKRYEDYAFANASVGINGTVVTNVNANALILREDYLYKVKALADVFRKYGIKIYLTARFSAPIELGKLKTADPLDPKVQEWWNNKVTEIYKIIPDFGGFCVKANSEGQPGPQDYKRNHADGANMLASALKPHGGIIMWRAFVYSHDSKTDRLNQAYNEFMPLDGKFADNVIVQVKNGPLDFQPREPIHPLFGKMTQTPVMLELQITKEYLGQGTHLVGLSKMFEEILQTDTYAKGKGSLLAKTIDGSLFNHKLTGIAGVSNIGTAFNWTGNLFAQADWYGFGRLAWNPYLSADEIHKEWIELTFSSFSQKAKSTAFQLLSESHEACVNYMTPLGLHHIMAEGHHFGPGPWVDSLFRADWTAVYYHKANPEGIGFDRTQSGTNLLEQYHPQFSKQYEIAENCPLDFLLWFHRIAWDQKLSTNRTLWEEMIYRYDKGVSKVSEMNEKWSELKGTIDEETFNSVRNHLTIQLKEAKWWRNACLAYFKAKGILTFPPLVKEPEFDYLHYKSLNYPYAPGLRPKW